MKKIYLLLFFASVFGLNDCFSQTYTWNVNTGSWTDSTSWTPFRRTRTPNDTLIFNGSVIPAANVSGVVKDSIACLQIINNANVTITSVVPTAGIGVITRNDTNVTGTASAFLQQFIPGDGFSHGGAGSGITEVKAVTGNNTLVSVGSSTTGSVSYNIWPRITVLDTTDNALFIQAGSKLTLSSSNPHSLSFYLAAKAKASISGTVELTNGRHKFFGADSNSIVFKSGSSLIIRGSYNGSAFGIAARNYTTFFESGSSFIGYNAISPFGTSTSLKLSFASGSRYIHKNTSINNLFNGRELSTLVIDTLSANDNLISIALGCVIDSLIINQATLVGFSGASDGSIVIRKALVVNSGTVNFGKGTGIQTVVLSNGINQPISIGGSGNIELGDNSVTLINNPAGVFINKSLTTSGILTLNAGNVFQSNNDTITIGTSIGTPGALSRVAGHFTGNGNLRRWIDVDPVSITSNTGLFPMGTATEYMPFNIETPGSSGGIIMVKAITGSGRSAINPSFYDTATTAVHINNRLNRGWIVQQNGFSASTFSIRGASEISSNAITNDSAVRIVLINSKAPGIALDGSGTTLFPEATRTDLSETDLNNTFYIGSDSSSNILPVRFVRIKAQRSADGINNITWETALEKNLRHFELEKSYDEKNFTKIKEIQASNGSTLKRYTAADRDDKPVYYRVKARGISGSDETSQVVIVDPSRHSSANAVYPNPSDSYITVLGNIDLEQVDKIDAFSASGQRFELFKSEERFSIQTLQPGIYFLHIRTTEGLQVLKFVKQ